MSIFLFWRCYCFKHFCFFFILLDLSTSIPTHLPPSNPFSPHVEIISVFFSSPLPPTESSLCCLAILGSGACLGMWSTHQCQNIKGKGHTLLAAGKCQCAAAPVGLLCPPPQSGFFKEIYKRIQYLKSVCKSAWNNYVEIFSVRCEDKTPKFLLYWSYCSLYQNKE